MNTRTRLFAKWKNILWLLLLVVAGIAVFLAAPIMKSGPQKVEMAERPVKVRAITVARLNVVPRVTGYGRVAPARTWEAVAEVAGQVKWIADELRDGRVVTAGTLMLRIEDSNYRLALTQAEAQLRASKVKNKTARDSLALAKRELVLLRADYERKKKLASKGTVAKVTVEAAERPPRRHSKRGPDTGRGAQRHC